MNHLIATYRLQLTPDFDFHAAASIAPYLGRLGISDLYLSPILEAKAGSSHGYDVTDPTRLRSDFGGLAGFQDLATAARAADLSLLIDIVPNHMAASSENPWWRDLLRNGEGSPFAKYFDLRTADASDRRLGLPILGQPLQEVIADGGLRIVADNGVWIEYGGDRLPIAPLSLLTLLNGEAPGLSESIRSAAEALEADPANRSIAEHLDRAIVEASVDPAQRRRVRDLVERRFARSPDRIVAWNQLLQEQHYRLMYWRDFPDVVPYRRFFDVTSLVCCRAEIQAVFDEGHRLLGRLMEVAPIRGFRVDHIDGLRDPLHYLQRLDRLQRERTGRSYTLVEKIVAPGESVPDEWPVAGTTGYEFINVVSGWFLYPPGLQNIRDAWRALIPATEDFESFARGRKRLAIDTLFPGELRLLASRMATIAERLRDDPSTCLSIPDPVDVVECAAAIREVTTALAVYRTYIREPRVDADDASRIRAAVASARAAGPGFTHLDLLEHMLLFDGVPRTGPIVDEILGFILDWQQFTGPVMAKGYEDTALYNDHALLAASEVGGDPANPCTTTPQLNGFLLARAETPLTLNATSTHDTKRGEDTRARSAVLTQCSDAWVDLIDRWLTSVPPIARRLSVRDELLLLQTLVTTWPLVDQRETSYRTRVREFMTKAVREGKLRSSWHEPDEEYEEVLSSRIDSLFRASSAGQLRAAAEMAERVGFAAALDSLAMTLLKITAPGVPDFYQGTETWALTLVDPDNRRQIDYDEAIAEFASLSELLARPAADAIAQLTRDWRNGRLKRLITALALAHRRRRFGAYESGAFIPLSAAGPDADRVFAFGRGSGAERTVIVVTRWNLRLEAGTGPAQREHAWSRTCLEQTDFLRGRWINVLTGRRIGIAHELPLATLFDALPFALLEQIA